MKLIIHSLIKLYVTTITLLSLSSLLSASTKLTQKNLKLQDFDFDKFKKFLTFIPQKNPKFSRPSELSNEKVKEIFTCLDKNKNGVLSGDETSLLIEHVNDWDSKLIDCE